MHCARLALLVLRAIETWIKNYRPSHFVWFFYFFFESIVGKLLIVTILFTTSFVHSSNRRKSLHLQFSSYSLKYYNISDVEQCIVHWTYVQWTLMNHRTNKINIHFNILFNIFLISSSKVHFIKCIHFNFMFFELWIKMNISNDLMVLFLVKMCFF